MSALKLLLELAPESVDLRCVTGDTALHLAVQFGDVLSIEQLLKAGADTGLRNGVGASAVECMGPDIGQNQRKVILGLFKKFKTNFKL